MNPEISHAHETTAQPELAALDALRGELLARFPRGPESDIVRYREWLRIELTYTSNAIEGNTLSAVETARVVDEDAVIPDKSLREHLEARDHAAAWDYATDVLATKTSLTAVDLLELHRKVLYSSNPDGAGLLRQSRIRVAGSHTVFPNPLKVPELFDQLIADVNEPGGIHPVVQAAHAHLDLVKIHPFIDGNGRTGRLLINVLLKRAGYLPIPIYAKDRTPYLAALEQADTDGGEAFTRLIIRLEHETMAQLLSDQ